MKKMMFLLIVTGLFASGCVQMRMDTVLEKDGKGTMTMMYGMSPAVAEALNELADMPGNKSGEEAPTLEDFDQDAIQKACRQHDCELKKFALNDDKTRLSFEIAFSSLENLSKALVDGQSSGGAGGFALYRTADGNYTIDSYEYEAAGEEAEEEIEVDIDADMSDMDPEAMQKSMAVMGKLMGAISELDVQMKITVPNDVISHNAHRVEGRTLIWEIDSSNMMQMSGEMEPQIVFSGKGLDIPALPRK